MTNKEILNRVQIVESLINGELRFVIVKRQEDGLIEASERRNLTEQEILSYTRLFMDYLLSKGQTEIMEPSTGTTWKFSKEQKNES